MSLYNLTQEYMELFENSFDENGEVTEESLQALALKEQDIQKRSIVSVKYLKNLENNLTMLDLHKQEIVEREKKLKKRMESIRNTLTVAMQQTGISMISCPFFDIMLRKSQPSVEVLELEAIPEEYIVTKITTQPDKIKIKNDLKAGIEVPGTRLTTNEHIVIK